MPAEPEPLRSVPETCATQGSASPASSARLLIVAEAALVDRSAGQSRFDVPAISLLELSFPFTINGDTIAEADETFEFVLSNVTGITVVDDRAKVTIIDNDTPKLSFPWGRVQAREWDVGSRSYIIPINLSRPAAVPGL